MTQTKIFTIGIDLPGEDFEYLPLHTRRSLLAAELVVFSPTLDLDETTEQTPEGSELLGTAAAARHRESLAYWRRELQTYLTTGRQIIVLLTAPREARVYDARGCTSAVVHSYDALPLNFRALGRSTDTLMSLTVNGTFLAPWWQTCAPYLQAETSFLLDGAEPLLTASDAQLVGASLHSGSGGWLLLPALNLVTDSFVYCDRGSKEYYWTDTAMAFGVQLAKSFGEIAALLKERAAGKEETVLQLIHESSSVAAPSWVAQERYRLHSEVLALAEIAEAQRRIEELQAQVAALQLQVTERQQRLPEAGRFKRLLYATGVELAAAVGDALQLLGCERNGATLSFTADRVRMLGASAGSSVAVDIDRVLHLEQALQDDFSQDGVASYARGVLFVNPFCDLAPSERPQLLTEKAMVAARRFGFVLVHTPDLYEVVQYLEGTEDRAFAEQVRAALRADGSEQVKFPSLPSSARG